MVKFLKDSEDLEDLDKDLDKPSKSSYELVKNCSYKNMQFRVGKTFNYKALPKGILEKFLEEGLVKKI